MQQAYDAAQNNAILDQHVRDKRADMLAHGVEDSGSEIGREMIASVPGQYESTEGPMVFEVDTKDVLSEDIQQEQPRNRAAEKAFSEWMYGELIKADKGAHQDRGQCAVGRGRWRYRGTMRSSTPAAAPFRTRKARFTSRTSSRAATSAGVPRPGHELARASGAEEGDLRDPGRDLGAQVRAPRADQAERRPPGRAARRGVPGRPEDDGGGRVHARHHPAPREGVVRGSAGRALDRVPGSPNLGRPENGAQATLEKLENQDIEMGLLQYMRTEGRVRAGGQAVPAIRGPRDVGRGDRGQVAQPREVRRQARRGRRSRAAG